MSVRPAFVRGAQVGERQRRFALERDRVAADAADDAGRQRQQARALDDFLGLLGVDLDDVAALVLAEPDGVRRQLALVGEELDAEGFAAAASAISAMATSRPPSETSCTARDLALADQRADRGAGLDLVGEVDRRRRALELAGRRCCW